MELIKQVRTLKKGEIPDPPSLRIQKTGTYANNIRLTG